MERLTFRDSNGNVHATRVGYYDIIDKLEQYEELEEQGLIPRFHLGDEFWTIRLGKILKAKIVMLQQKKV